MKFDFVIGNPPYQDETIGDNKGFAPPVYHKFLENAYKIGDVVEMIHRTDFYLMPEVRQSNGMSRCCKIHT